MTEWMGDVGDRGREGCWRHVKDVWKDRNGMLRAIRMDEESNKDVLIVGVDINIFHCDLIRPRI